MLINQEDTSVTPKDYCGNCDIADRYDATQILVNRVCNNDVAQWKEHCMLRIEKCTDLHTCACATAPSGSCSEEINLCSVSEHPP